MKGHQTSKENFLAYKFKLCHQENKTYRLVMTP